ncbi:oxidoreductase [Paraburkholderia steynii]|uniref:Oxidoreductase n=1 Tax=Paraburkholderia steynii TaxID=1245441 RepID=A0A4R0XBY7_9BURK|nr:oxidoreductase [Paraburkholderia steynii]
MHGSTQPHRDVSSLKVGFIGLGMMGLPMVESLANRFDGELLAFDASPAPFDKLAAHPQWQKRLRQARSMTEFAACNVVITMLPNSTITNAVILGNQTSTGLATVLSTGAIVVDMGSSNPADTLTVSARLAEHGIDLVDAPVSGAVAKARTGTLTLMVGGPEAALERVRPILETMGSTIFPTGDVSSAHAMKALNNYVYAAGLLAASEALLIAHKLGLDPVRFTEVLNASSGRNVATETKLSQFIIPGTFAGGFALRLQSKDIATAAGLQHLAGISTPLLDLCASVWADAVQTLAPNADNTEIFRFLQQKNLPVNQ